MFGFWIRILDKELRDLEIKKNRDFGIIRF